MFAMECDPLFVSIRSAVTLLDSRLGRDIVVAICVNLRPRNETGSR